MAFTRMIFATMVAILALESSASPLSRLKRDDAECRKEGLLVGGTIVGGNYTEAATEADCVAQCNELEKCTAVNYFPDHEACLPQEENLLNTEEGSLSTAENVAGTVYIMVKNCGPQPEKRSKRQTTECRQEGLMVGGSVVGTGDYIIDIATEADCIAECNKIEKCTAVNYFPDYQACLPQEENLITHKESINSEANPITNYVIVKGCEIKERRKREIEGCRKEGLIVGATYIGEGYVKEVKSEQDCIDKCNAEQECNAINYYPSHEACLLQRETLITDVDRLSTTTEDKEAIYVIVKGCTGSMPDPRPQPKETTDEPETAPTQEPEETGPSTEAPTAELVPDEEEPETSERRKRQTECRKEKLFVDGEVIEGVGYVLDIKTEEACIAECNKLEKCTAVNYFPMHEACLPQQDNLITNPGMRTREEDITNYIIVKGCGGTQPEQTPEPTLPPLPKPDEDEQ